MPFCITKCLFMITSGSVGIPKTPTGTTCKRALLNSMMNHRFTGIHFFSSLIFLTQTNISLGVGEISALSTLGNTCIHGKYYRVGGYIEAMRSMVVCITRFHTLDDEMEVKLWDDTHAAETGQDLTA